MKSLTFSKKNDSAVYMDGPNTNWEVFGLLKEHQNEEEQPSLFWCWKLQTACNTRCVSNKKQ